MKHYFLPFIPKSLSLAVIALALTAGAWAQTETIAYSFTGGSDGGSPSGGVILDSKGNLYGAAESGGANGAGAIFELTPSSGGGWAEQVLYSFNGFANQNDGYFPFGGLVFDKKGNLYGTTIGGGPSFQGTAFELSRGSNGTWTETVIYNFAGGTSVGSPQSMSFAIDGAGNLYGISVSGCAYGYGCIFELVAGSPWTLKILHSFTGGNDGYEPFGGSPVLDGAGNLYGSTTGGGLHDYGVLFKLTPQSNGTWSEKVLYSFNGLGGVAAPTGKLTIDSQGNIYGTAYDAFELSPDSNGIYKEKDLHFFTGGKDGALPEAGVTSDSAGNLYGTTNTGGAHRGTVFELSPGSNGTWTEKVLHAFSATGGDGVYPYVFPLSVDGQGHLYGVTSTGGSSNYGVVYEVTP
jgi:uncharacterized repeat protein (TIGR03803 family)